MAKIKYNQIEKINLLDEKVNLISGDYFLIEDSQDAYKVKKYNRLNFPSDSDKNFVHDQVIPSAIWNITHNLNKFPAVGVVDTAGSEVEGDIQHINNNNLTIIFSSAFSGKAYIN